MSSDAPREPTAPPTPTASIAPTTRRVCILLFPEVEVLDFTGPFEVFSVTGRRAGIEPFDVYTTAAADRVSARNGLSVVPSYRLQEAPRSEVLVVPGGFGTRALLDNDEILNWIRSRAGDAQLVLSVCTGALVLAAAGLLDGLEATTHHKAMDELRGLAPGTRISPDERWVDNGKFVLSAGVAAGIEASLHVVSRLLGSEWARETAEYIEYPWHS